MKVKCTTDRWDFLTYGKEYDVIREEDGKYYVYDDDGDENELWDYECEVIEESNKKVDESTQESTKEFKIGDKVKIVKKNETEPNVANWVPEMNMTIGCIGIVNDINQKAVAVRLETGGYWWYSNESLELIEEAKQDNDYVSYQEFLDAFDYDRASVKISKTSVEISYGIDKFTCTTKQREQEVMKALIVLYGKREGEN